MGFVSRIKDGITICENENGAVIATAKDHVKTADGFAFRDLSGTEELLPYEDWRLSPEARAKDLTDRLSVYERIGLMLHTDGQSLPSVRGKKMHPDTYNGKPFAENPDARPSDVTDQQKELLQQSVRHFVAASYDKTESVIDWVNGMQKLAEALPYGIPMNLSSDPRHGAGGGFNAEFVHEDGGVSLWPEGLAMACTGNPAQAAEYARIVSKEYRALGITTALGPQIDLASDPRWFRFSGTLGADLEQNIAMTKAICDGFQTTEGSSTGWGRESVIAMAKHWPGGGTGEGGRDAHYPFGKYAVYPGEQFENHLRPFTEGAFQLPGKTGCCAAIMPYYTISYDQDRVYGENVGNSFSKYIISDLLIEKYGYQGLICTDWALIADQRPHVGTYMPGGKCYGVEELSKAERVLKMIANGVNQFGGQSDRGPVDEAYDLGSRQYGQEFMDGAVKLSAYKALLNMFRVGLFDNPYLDKEESLQTLANAVHCRKGMEAQLAAAVLLKNAGKVLPLKKGIRLYVPKKHHEAYLNFARMASPAEDCDPINGRDCTAYFTRVDSVEESDAVLMFLDGPFGRNGYQFDAMKLFMRQPQPEEPGYYPISLQYRPYTAETARRISIAGGDPNETTKNRSYFGKTETTANEKDLDTLLEAAVRAKGRPVICVISSGKPFIPAEFEPSSDAILYDPGVSMEAILSLLFGEAAPTGRLPMILPADMITVEQHCEDCPDDMIPYTDSEGNVYTFGFGLTVS